MPSVKRFFVPSSFVVKDVNGVLRHIPTKRQCTLCKVEVSHATSNTGLMAHLFSKHMSEYDLLQTSKSKFKARHFDSCASASSELENTDDHYTSSDHRFTPAKKKFKQSSISTMLENTKPAWEVDASVIAFATNTLPHQLIDNPDFRAFIQHLRAHPSVPIPTRRQIRQRILSGAKHIKEQVFTHLQSSFVTLAIDSWTNVRSECVTNICGIVQGHAFFLTSITNKYSEKNSADWLLARIQPYVKYLIEKHRLQIIAVVTDNGSNMVKLGEMMEKEFGIVHLPCAAHLLQLMVKKLIAHKEFKDAICAMLNLMQLFKTKKEYRSRLLMYQLRSTRPDGSKATPLRLVKPNDTRWSSTYYCIRRLLALEDVVRRVMLNEDGALTDNEWTTLKLLVKLLKPFQMATDMVQADSANLLDCYTALKLVNEHVECFAADMKTKNHLAVAAIAAEWKKTFSYYADKQTKWTNVVCACMQMLFNTVEDDSNGVLAEKFGKVARIHGHETFLSFGANIIHRYQIIPSSKQLSVERIVGKIRDEHSDFTWQRGPCVNFHQELKDVIDRREPLLNAFTKYRQTHPFLTTTVHIFLSMYVTEAAVERTFSAQDQVHSKKRNTLLDDIVEAEMIIKFNVNVLRRMAECKAKGIYPHMAKKKKRDELPYSTAYETAKELADVPPIYASDIQGSMHDDDDDDENTLCDESIDGPSKEEWETMEEDEEEVDIERIKQTLLSFDRTDE